MHQESAASNVTTPVSNVYLFLVPNLSNHCMSALEKIREGKEPGGGGGPGCLFLAVRL